MTSTEFHGVTRVLVPPDGWKDSAEASCLPMYIRDDTLAGYHSMQSVWSLTAEERFAVARGANISVMILGCVHPPIAVTVDNVKVLDEGPFTSE